MRRTILGLALLLAISAQAASAQSLGRHQATILSAAGGGPETLNVMPAGRELSWATWSDDTGDRHSVRFALLRRKQRTAVALWSAKRADAYAPTLAAVPVWTFAGNAVVLLSYQLGAAYTRAELYGLDPQGKPLQLGSAEGALIVTVPVDGQPVLKVYPSADLQTVNCYGWDQRAGKLHPQVCH